MPRARANQAPTKQPGIVPRVLSKTNINIRQKSSLSIIRQDRPPVPAVPPWPGGGKKLPACLQIALGAPIVHRQLPGTLYTRPGGEEVGGRRYPAVAGRNRAENWVPA